jgi:hypothetical protein
LALGGLNGEVDFCNNPCILMELTCWQVQVFKLSELLLEYSGDKDAVVAAVVAATQTDLAFT